jgi:hypothetical protein
VASYPALADTIHIGHAYGPTNRNLTVIKISDNVGVDENEPEVLYMGNHHARELMSVEIPLMFAQYLLQHYGSDPVVTNYVNTREIYIMPTVNPDGLAYVQANHSGASGNWWRKNRRNNGNGTFGVDINRNYSYKWGLRQHWLVAEHVERCLPRTVRLLGARDAGHPQFLRAAPLHLLPFVPQLRRALALSVGLHQWIHAGPEGVRGARRRARDGHELRGGQSRARDHLHHQR